MCTGKEWVDEGCCCPVSCCGENWGAHLPPPAQEIHPPPPSFCSGKKNIKQQESRCPRARVSWSISALSLTLLFIPGLGALMEPSQPFFWVNYFIISFSNWIADSTVWIQGCALAHPSPAARNKKLWMLKIAVEKPTFNACLHP